MRPLSCVSRRLKCPGIAARRLPYQEPHRARRGRRKLWGQDLGALPACVSLGLSFVRMAGVAGFVCAGVGASAANDTYRQLDRNGTEPAHLLAAGSAGSNGAGNPSDLVVPPNAHQGQDRKLDVEVATYAWIINTGGSVRRGRTRINLTASFIDYWRLSDEFGIFMGKVEARYRRFGIYVDFVRASNGININTQAFDLAGRLTIPQLRGKLSVVQVVTDVVGFFRFHDSKLDGHTGVFGMRRVTMDALVGFRYSRQSIKLAVDANGALQFRVGPITVTRTAPDARFASTSENYDPLLGFRLGVQASRKVHLTLRGDVGGFGVGSEFTWNVVALVRYQVPVWGYPVNLLVGYRGLCQHTVDGAGTTKVISKVTQHGPILGVSVRF